MRNIYLGLGSNVGDRLSFLTQAISRLANEGIVSKISSVYETPPWGNEDQPVFLNACVQFQTKLEPESLLNKLKQIENELGRKGRERWGPREIDIDILFYGSEQINSQRLTIPHPLLHERAFVLVSLAEIAPDFVHPVLKKDIKELLTGVDTKNIKKYN